MSASRIIIFNPDRTKYLVGKESYFISNINSITDDMKIYIDTLFSRKVKKIKDHNDKHEIDFYSKRLKVFLGNKEIMKIVNENSDSTRITFGDIRYKKIGNQIYSYTVPQYVPKGSYLSFPGGQPSTSNSDSSCALRELHEETNIDLTKEPYNIHKLKNTNKTRKHYLMFYYILNSEEYTHALDDIKIKNNCSHAELHDLQFVNATRSLSINAIKNLRKTRKLLPN